MLTGCHTGGCKNDGFAMLPLGWREMNYRGLRSTFARSLSTGSLAVLAACTATPPPPPPPAPPPVVMIPIRPLPPLGAAPNLILPPLASDGTRITINSGLSSKQALWNLRSAYNVAALNCQNPIYQPLSNNYAQFLKANKKQLASVYKDLDKQFKKDHGEKYIQTREVFQTQVYNYFAFPPVLPAFCNAMTTIGMELSAIPAKSLEEQAPLELARLERVYQDFYLRYAQYSSDVAAWDAQYGNVATALNSTIPPTGSP